MGIMMSRSSPNSLNEGVPRPFTLIPQPELGAAAQDQTVRLRWLIQGSPSLGEWVALPHPTAPQQKIMLEALLRREVLRLFAAEFEARDESITGSGQPGDPYTKSMGWIPECQIADWGVSDWPEWIANEPYRGTGQHLFPLRHSDTDPAWYRIQVAELLGLPDCLAKRIAEITGGQYPASWPQTIETVISECLHSFRERLIPSDDDEPEIQAMKPAKADFHHSPDYRSVRFQGQQFTFSQRQALSVQILHLAWQGHTPEVGQDRILEDIGSLEKPVSGRKRHLNHATRLRDIFRKNPAWKTLIIPGKSRGSYRLNLPDRHR